MHLKEDFSMSVQIVMDQTGDSRSVFDPAEKAAVGAVELIQSDESGG
jgi:hypothetical protein